MTTYQPAQCFDALGDPTRRAIFDAIGKAPASVAELASAMPVSRPAVSQHLKVLKTAGLVSAETVGTRHIYRVDFRGVRAMRSYLDQFWGDALEAFSQHLESTKDQAYD